MASNAIAGVGTRFMRWANGSFADIAEVNSISGPTMSREQIDVTSLDSTGGYREFIAGFRDAGTVSLSMNFTRATYDVMLGDFESEEIQNYAIMLPDAEFTLLEFEGMVTELPLSISPDDKVTVDVTIKITGAIDVASGSSGI